MEASDNVMVAKVQITILDAEGKVLEQGEAVQAEVPSTRSGWWGHVLSKEGKLLAEARVFFN